MLGKLIQFNIKSISRIMLPIYLILLATTVSTTILVSFQVDAVAYQIFLGFSMFAYVISLVALLVGSMIAILVHFYKSTICDQAYFTFTLPASINQHLIANTLVGCFWMILSIVLSLTSMISVFIGYNKAETIRIIKETLHLMNVELKSELGISGGFALFLFIFLFVFSLVLQMNLYQLCFAAGQTFRGHKLAGSFVVYIISYFIMEIILMIPLVISMLIGHTDLYTLKDFSPFLIIYLILYLAFAIVTFYLANYFFSHKMNLE